MDLVNKLARENPEELVRLVALGQEASISQPSIAPPPQSVDPTLFNELLNTLKLLADKSTAPNPAPSVRKQGINVTPYDGDPESLHRFLAELTAKINLEKWTDEYDKVAIAESLLVKGKRADKLMDAYRVLGQTEIDDFDKWKKCLTELCQDTGAQEKANRKLMNFHYEKNSHRSFAEFFAEFCVLAGKSSKSDETKYDQLVMGTPAWLRRLARPIPSSATSPNWRALAQHYNDVFTEDDQIKADENHWRGLSSTPTKALQFRKTRQPDLAKSPTVPSLESRESSPPTGDPMDIDQIQTSEQATELVQGKKLNDWIRKVCQRFDLCLFCRKSGHRIKECPFSLHVQTVNTNRPKDSEN